MNTEKELFDLCDDMIAVISAPMKKYVLTWTGSKIPRGARIGNIGIAWTQHGRILGKNSEELGFYQRTKEWENYREIKPGGGMVGEHEMIVSANEQVYDTQGNPCELMAEESNENLRN